MIANSKLFPTQFQTSSLGILNFVSHIIGVGAPIVAEMPNPYPFYVFLGNCVIAGVACLFLKEINNEVIIKKHSSVKIK